MKKLFTGLGLFLGGFIIHILFAYLLLIFTSTITIFFSFSLNFTLIIDIIILILASIGTVLIIKLLKNRFNIGVARFITTFQLPVAVLSTAYFIFIKFSGFLFNILDDSKMEYILTLATSISSTIILYLTVITCLVIYIVKKRISKAEFNSI